MNDIDSTNGNITLSVQDSDQHESICKIGRALAVPKRLKILQSLLCHSKNLLEISKELNMPISSVSRHIDALLDAKLIFVYYPPGMKGHTKLCNKLTRTVTVLLSESDTENLP